MDEIQKYLIGLLEKENAHDSFFNVVSKFPIALINEKVPGRSYTPWHLLEHIRIAQKDIIDYVIGTNYKELKWPDEYWPAQTEKSTREQWEKTVTDYKKDIEEWNAYVKKNYNMNVLKKTILILDHTAYHVGELSLASSVLRKAK